MDFYYSCYLFSTVVETWKVNYFIANLAAAMQMTINVKLEFGLPSLQ